MASSAAHRRIRYAPTIIGVLSEVSGDYAVPFLMAAAIQIIAGAVIVAGRQRSSVAGFVRDRK